MKTPAFLMLISMDFFTIMPLKYFASIFKTMGLQLGTIDDLSLTVAGSIGALVNGISRLVIGNF